MGWTCDRALAARARIPDAARFTDVAFRDAVADPIGCAARIYAAVGLELTASGAAMEAWLAQDAREKPPAHRYSAEHFGLTERRDPRALRRLHAGSST